MSHVFARCASQKTHGHARIAHATKSDTSGHCLPGLVVLACGPGYPSQHEQAAAPSQPTCRDLQTFLSRFVMNSNFAFCVFYVE